MREFGPNECDLITIYHDSDAAASDMREQYRFIDAIIEKSSEITAMLIWTEEIAAELVVELGKKGKSVPENLSIISFNSSIVSAQNNPPITSISQPFEEIGKAAVRKLIEIINHHEPSPGVERLPVNLDIRSSCRRLSEAEAKPKDR